MFMDAEMYSVCVYKKIKIKWISILSYSLILVQNEVN